MRHEFTGAAAASPERVWAVLVDVRHWPEWNNSVTEVTLLDDGALHVGSRVRLRQPRLTPAVWEVTELDPFQRFVWTTGGSGAVMTGSHEIAADETGGTVVTLTFEVSGFAAPIIGLFYGRLIRRYLAMEAAGLQRQAESAT